MEPKKLLYTKDYLFYEEEASIVQQQIKIIEALETLKLDYEIKRKHGYGTNTPTWEVKVYQR